MQIRHKNSINLLSKITATQNMPHALVFTGPRGIGKKAVAIELAKWLLAPHKSVFSNFSGKTCTCASCQRVDVSSHPDLYQIHEDIMNIEQVRDLKSRFSFTPFYALRKIAIIDNADNMRPEAANALLKTLEEPRGEAVFILIAASRKKLLPTISSRVFEVRFIAPPSFYEGAMVDGDTHNKLRDFVSSSLAGKFSVIRGYNTYTRGNDPENKSTRAELISFLDAWIIKLRKRLLAEDPGAREYRLIKDILRAKQLISTTNINPQLILEKLCVMHYL